jgi:hypothetical protein
LFACHPSTSVESMKPPPFACLTRVPIPPEDFVPRSDSPDDRVVQNLVWHFPHVSPTTKPYVEFQNPTKEPLGGQPTGLDVCGDDHVVHLPSTTHPSSHQSFLCPIRVKTNPQPPDESICFPPLLPKRCFLRWSFPLPLVPEAFFVFCFRRHVFLGVDR